MANLASDPTSKLTEGRFNSPFAGDTGEVKPLSMGWPLARRKSKSCRLVESQQQRLSSHYWVVGAFFSISLLESSMVTSTSTPAVSTVNPREKALEDFRKKIMEHKEIEARLKNCMWIDAMTSATGFDSFQCAKSFALKRRNTIKPRTISRLCKASDKYTTSLWRLVCVYARSLL